MNLATLRAAAAAIEALRLRLVFDEDEAQFDALTPFAEQHFLAALAALESAHRSMTLADLHEAREIGGKR